MRHHKDLDESIDDWLFANPLISYVISLAIIFVFGFGMLAVGGYWLGIFG